MSTHRQILIGLLGILFTCGIAAADYKDDSKVVKLSGGENHSLILTENKWLWAFGYNGGSEYDDYRGILGTGSSQSNLKEHVPVRVHGQGDVGFLEDINDFDAGYIHSLAVDINGYVWAWGDNYYGQLGDNKESGSVSTVPVKVHGYNNEGFLDDIIAVAAGRSGAHSLAVDANSFVWAWGLNNTGQLGNGGEGTEQLTPVQVVGGAMGSTWLKYIIEVSGGEDNSAARDANGLVYTWGKNDYGQLGSGTTGSYSTVPVKVLSGQQDPCSPDTFLQNIVAIDSGWDHLLALEKTDPLDSNFKGYVYAWGRNSENSPWTDYGGQLGDGTDNDCNTPVKVLSGEQDPGDPNSYLKDIIAVSAGDCHSIALDAEGNIWTWGNNEYGQLGIAGSDPCSLTPVKVLGLDGVGYLEDIVSISAGYWHCLAIDADGTLWTWGKHSAGSLGLGNAITEQDSNTPNPVGVVYNLTKQDFQFGIQKAIKAANSSGDFLEALPFTYFEDVDFIRKTINLSSTDPNDWATVEKTIIQGSGSGLTPAVNFKDNSDSVLKGFTITNGYEGVHGDSSSPDIINCIIKNSTYYGIYCLDGSSINVKNTKIIDNGIHPINYDGLYCNNAEIMLSDCIIKNNGDRGIRCRSSDLTVSNCIIEGNPGDGIYISGLSSSLISNSIIRGNTDNGIYFYNITGEIVITDNWIHNNGAANNGEGIYINSNSAPSPPYEIRHNTIADNDGYGIESDYAEDVSVNHCIVWGNAGSQLHSAVGTFAPTYSCINGSWPGEGNIRIDPCFAAPDANDYHLRPDSESIDAGNSEFAAGPDETDIDGEPRIIDGDGNDTIVVDIGADEYYVSPADFNGDDIVNFFDYDILAGAWQTSAGQDGYNEIADLEDNNSIDANDLALFCNDWLWYPGWTRPGTLMKAARGDTGGKQLSAPVKPEKSQVQSSQTAAEKTVDEELSLEQIIELFEEAWRTDEKLREIITEDEWQKFIDELKAYIE